MNKEIYMGCPMETRWSWVQPLHSTMASSELRDIYEVYNREVRKLGCQPMTQYTCSVNSLPLG